MSFVIVSLLALLVSISALGARIEAKPLNQNQVKFRRLPPKEFSASLGSSITIECEAGSSPPPTIHWLKNGKRILQNELDENQLEDHQPMQVDEANKIALSSTRSRLFIDCADYSDEAVYTCVAENTFSRVSSHTKLNLIKPLPPTGSVSDNDLLSGAIGEAEVAALELAAAAAGGAATSAGVKQLVEAAEKSLTAVPQCLSQRNARISSEPVRIHMWTHNIVEVMKNDIVLYCRSNANKKQLQQLQLNSANTQEQQSQQDTPNNLNSIRAKLVSTQEVQLEHQDSSNKPLVVWTLPDEKPVGAEQKDKYEILETGDLLIKDLRWADMGSYVCTVSDDQSSDSVSAFVYPASVKLNSKRATLNSRLADYR